MFEEEDPNDIDDVPLKDGSGETVDSDGFADAFAKAFFALGSDPDTVNITRALKSLADNGGNGSGSLQPDSGAPVPGEDAPLGAGTIYGDDGHDSTDDSDFRKFDPDDLGDEEAIL